MKKIMILIFLGSLLPAGVMACDICGCGVGSSYIGLLPDFNMKILGLRYRYNSLQTHIGAGGIQSYLTTKEVYRTTELWGGWTIHNKFRVLASVPFNFNEKIKVGGTSRKVGPGDISFTGFYQLINSRKAAGAGKLLVQSLWIGAGLKLPTGHYDPEDKEANNQNANLFQLGTGSVDVTLNAMYDIRLQDAGLNISAGYKMNTINKHDYRYGDKLNLSTQAYYKFRICPQLLLSPNAGVAFERAEKDVHQKFRVDMSGGNISLATVGLEAVSGRLAFGANWQAPLSQQLAKGSVKAADRMMLHVAVLL
jgi:hypothetical protein